MFITLCKTRLATTETDARWSRDAVRSRFAPVVKHGLAISWSGKPPWSWGYPWTLDGSWTMENPSINGWRYPGTPINWKPPYSSYRILFVIGDRVTGFGALTVEHIAEDVEYFPQTRIQPAHIWIPSENLKWECLKTRNAPKRPYRPYLSTSSPEATNAVHLKRCKAIRVVGIANFLRFRVRYFNRLYIGFMMDWPTRNGASNWKKYG
jgi:hypothetical protein